jgi:hypothetical protein
VILVQTNILGQTEALAGFNLFNSSLGIIECNAGVAPACFGQAGIYQSADTPAAWTMTTEINSTNQLVMTNSFGSYTFNTEMPTGAFISLGYNNGLQNTGGTPLLTPELVFVGATTNLFGTAQANFGLSTSGTVQSFVETSDGSWSSSVSLVAHQHSDSLSAESSTGLQWTLSTTNGGSFGTSGVSAEGIGFVPSTTIAQATIQSGQTSVDQISSTGVSVVIMGSTASNGTQVTIATASEGSVQPPGTGQLNLGSAGYYDVNVSYFDPTTNMPVSPDGTTTICISNPTITAQTSMKFDSNGLWDQVPANNTTFSTDPANTICGGDIPVSALSGTPIAIGPLELGKPPKVDLDATVRSLTLNRKTREYDVVLDITDSGTLAANDVKVTLAELNGTPTSTALPVSLGDLSYAASATVTLTFPTRERAEEGDGFLRIVETYAGGTDEQVVRVKLPHRSDRDDDDGRGDDHERRGDDDSHRS